MKTTEPQSTTEPKLEPCPFCGVSLILLGDYNDESAWNWYGHPSADDSDCLLSQHRIRTKSDLCTPMTVDMRAWNSRTAAPTVAPVVDLPEGQWQHVGIKSGNPRVVAISFETPEQATAFINSFAASPATPRSEAGSVAGTVEEALKCK